MISAAEFKKEISKILGAKLRAKGFKGSNFHFSMESNEFVFVIGIQASQYGGYCYMEFGIQPKVINVINGQTIDIGKIRHFQCEFRMRLSRHDNNSDQWAYADSSELNQQVAESMIDTVNRQVIPIISKFMDEPFSLDSIEVSDLENIYKYIPAKLAGLGVMTGEIRLAWALTKLHGKDNRKGRENLPLSGYQNSGAQTLPSGDQILRLLWLCQTNFCSNRHFVAQLC